MDPVANLEEQKRLCAKHKAESLTQGELDRWKDLREALRDWRNGGGFMPDTKGLDFSPVRP